MLRNIFDPALISALKSTFDHARNVVITCHTSPDGDAIGSCLALKEFLTKKGKSVHVIVPNYFPDFLRWMHGVDDIIQYDRAFAHSKTLIQHADLIVVLDFNDLSRLNELQLPISLSRAKKVMIDHHEHPTRFADISISVPAMSSTCELLYRIFMLIGRDSDINRHAAEDLYTGMCTDTGQFTYNSNDPEIFEIVAALMRKGIDKDRIIRNIYSQNTLDRYRLQGYVLAHKLVVDDTLHAAYFALTKEELAKYNYLKGDAEGWVNIPLTIKGVKVSISLREDTEKPQINVSIRSLDDIPANEMARRYFNGGGHFNAAGGRLSCSLDEAIRIAQEALEAYRPQLTAEAPQPEA